MTECVFLLVTQDRKFFIGTHVGAVGVELGEEMGKCRFFLVMSGRDLFARDEQIFVVLHGQRPTAV